MTSLLIDLYLSGLTLQDARSDTYVMRNSFEWIFAKIDLVSDRLTFPRLFQKKPCSVVNGKHNILERRKCQEGKGITRHGARLNVHLCDCLACDRCENTGKTDVLEKCSVGKLTRYLTVRLNGG